jgi:hypothetical protein
MEPEILGAGSETLTWCRHLANTLFLEVPCETIDR